MDTTQANPFQKQLSDDETEIRPRTRIRTTDPSEGVDIAFGNGKMQKLDPVTVGKVFKKTVEELPNGIALRYKENNKLCDIKYSQYYEMVIQVAKSLIKVSSDIFECHW